MSDGWRVARRYDPVLVARLFDVMPHLVVDERALPAGYWRDEEQRQIARRGIRRRLRRWWAARR